MGGGASKPPVRSTLHELSGKKCLQCPILSSIHHPTTNDRWALIAFAPMGFFGLIFAARNMATKELLAKEFTDAELGKEKERQGIAMSWNVTFKAIATDLAASTLAAVSSTGEGDGVPWSFTVSGSLALAVKVQLQGVAMPRGKPPDVFRCELVPVEASQANIFRYFIEPLAAFACKKRTDLVDRPDPAKERSYGHWEAMAIVKGSTVEAAQASIALHRRRLDELKQQLTQLRRAQRVALATATAQALLLRQVPVPPGDASRVLAIGEAMAGATARPEAYQDPLLLDPPAGPVAAPSPARPPPPPLFPAEAPGHGDLPRAEQNATVAARGGDADSPSPAAVAFYTLHRFIPSAAWAALGLDDGALWQTLSALEPHYPTQQLWFSAPRVVFLQRMLLHHLAQPPAGYERQGPADCVGLAMPADAVVALVLAAMCVGLHRPRLTDELCCAESEHCLASLYPCQPLAHHAVAVLYSIAAQHHVASRKSVVRSVLPLVVQLVGLVDTSDSSSSSAGDASQGSLPRTLKALFAKVLAAHEAAPADVRTTWVMAMAAYHIDVASTSMSLQGLPSCSSMTTTAMPASPQFSVSHNW